MTETYNEPFETPEGTQYDHYTVKLEQVMQGSRPVAVVHKNGEPIGALTCKSKEEFAWLKDRITGTRIWTPSESD